MMRWWVALAGLFLLIFAVVALSGPGRIDILDGRVRYEAARSLVDHGDVDIEDPTILFTILPGRGGRRYSEYRFPQSLAGVAAILVSDATGPVCEARREFLFTLTGAVASAVLAVTYATLFRRLGHGHRASMLWAVGGIFCTPNWYYGTSTFDDILGSATVVLAVAIALGCRQRRRWAGAVAAGLALGLAFNCKQPLGIFILPVMASLYDPAADWRSQWKRLATVAALLAAGVAVCEGFHWYKFPPGSTVGLAALPKDAMPIWSHDPVIALVALLISPAAGVFFYNPPLLLCIRGMLSWHRVAEAFLLVARGGHRGVHPVHLLPHLLQRRPRVGPALRHTGLRGSLDHGPCGLPAHAPAFGRRSACGGTAGANQCSGHRPVPALHQERIADALLRVHP